MDISKINEQHVIIATTAVALAQLLVPVIGPKRMLQGAVIGAAAAYVVKTQKGA